MEKTMAEPAVKLTHGDYLLIPEDGLKHEIIDGEHVVTAAPRWRHQLIIGDLYFALRSAVHALGSGVVVLSPMDVILSSGSRIAAEVRVVPGECNQSGRTY